MSLLLRLVWPCVCLCVCPSCSRGQLNLWAEVKFRTLIYTPLLSAPAGTSHTQNDCRHISETASIHTETQTHTLSVNVHVPVCLSAGRKHSDRRPKTDWRNERLTQPRTWRECRKELERMEEKIKQTEAKTCGNDCQDKHMHGTATSLGKTTRM